MAVQLPVTDKSSSSAALTIAMTSMASDIPMSVMVMMVVPAKVAATIIPVVISCFPLHKMSPGMIVMMLVPVVVAPSWRIW